jgi:hypothetical protein
MNSFTDFIDVTRGLVDAGYGHSEKIFVFLLDSLERGDGLVINHGE